MKGAFLGFPPAHAFRSARVIVRSCRGPLLAFLINGVRPEG